MLRVSALQISMDLISFGSQPDRSITSSSQPTLYYSERVKLLKFWQCSFISGHHISIIMAPSEDVYIRQKCRDALVLS